MNKTNSNRRLESTKKYIDALSEQYSKLNIVRVDLSYKKPYSDSMGLEDVNKDIEHMLNNMRSNPKIFKDKVGYILKKEYTPDKGVHCHAIFIYDGQKIQNDSYKAEQICEYWNKHITQDKGSSHNCHRNKYERKGIGMLDYKDNKKRKILDEDVVNYLCKDGQDVTPLKNSKKQRAFTRGTIPRGNTNIGRPRNK